MALSASSTARASLRQRGIWSRWKHLPRDGRDTLFLLGIIAWTTLPHVAHLAPWCTALTALMLLWRAQLALTHGALPNRWLVIAILAVCTGLTLFSEGTLFGKEAGVTMLVVLMALKTLELRLRRDAIVVFFLGFFLVLTNFLYSQSLLTALAMLVSVWGLLTALVLAHMPAGTPSLRFAGGVAARAALLGAPLMVALFLLFPRFGPLWGVPQDAIGKTGLSGSLRMGGMATLANDDSVALRVRFIDRAPPPEAMYFRGPVLSRFDGREWTRLQSGAAAAARARLDMQLLGAPLRYEMTLEPSRLALLPLLELTPDRPGAAPRVDGYTTLQRADLQWQTDRPVVDRLRFDAAAWLLQRHGQRALQLTLQDHLELPPGYNPRTVQWAADLRRQPALADADARTLVAAVLAHIRSAGFVYTLEPGPYGADAIDEFWLDRKLGFCEHFAASFVFIMRTLGVPARIVTGYQGGEFNSRDGQFVVRQSDAHAWAEFWQAGDGWLRVDPTAAVAPERISRAQRLVPQPGLVAGAIGKVSPQLLAQLREFLDATTNEWNLWVMNYSRKQQFSLLESLGVAAPTWHDLAYALIVLLCTGSLAGAGWALWDRHRQDPWQRLQQRSLELLRRLHVSVLPSDPPRTRALRVREQLGSQGEALAREFDALDRARYAGIGRMRVERAWWRRLSAAAAQIGHR